MNKPLIYIPPGIDTCMFYRGSNLLTWLREIKSTLSQQHTARNSFLNQIEQTKSELWTWNLTLKSIWMTFWVNGFFSIYFACSMPWKGILQAKWQICNALSCCFPNCSLNIFNTANLSLHSLLVFPFLLNFTFLSNVKLFT